jgi:alkanesulfonate monooxygenase SsuD/methylene tetrahydromethanopterin reductase-like flavin-dependent oxidoreductase (luciferase family)
VQIGYHLTPFWSPTDRSPARILDEAIDVVRASASMGFAWVSIGQHWLSHPTIWPAPIPFLARIAPETGQMRLKTSVLLLPLLNPVETAENVATLDHLSHGRLTVGISIGYREVELAAAGQLRSSRVARLESALDVMKRLWSGEEVFGARMGFLPYQRPHPPIEFGAQSEGATRRAARLGDAVFFGPQVAWADVRRLAGVYREETSGGIVGASRCLMVGRNRDDAARRAQLYLEKTFAMYTRWSMQEDTVVPLVLDSSRPLDDWTVHGSPADCVARLLQAEAEIGLDGVGFTIYSLPERPAERIEYLQMIAEEIISPVLQSVARAPGSTDAR